MKTKFRMNIRNTLIALPVLCSVVLAQEATTQDSLVSAQKSLLQKLRGLETNSFGLGFDGKAKSGYLSSDLSSDQMAADEPDNETGAFTEIDLTLSARPSKESRARIDARLHQDWQRAHQEGLNPLLIHWWSWDGTGLDKKLQFNIGDMRVGYTPLTMYTPGVEVLQEPEIFQSKRQESMAYRNLDGSNNRLLQGANVAYGTGQAGFFDDIRVQGTAARLRNNAKKPDQMFFDFDLGDRYLLASRLGFDIAGFSIGGNYVNAFDRIKSTRTIQIVPGDSIHYEDNRVISAELGWDSKAMISPEAVRLGLRLEYAMSNWTHSRDTGIEVTVANQRLVKDFRVLPDGTTDTSIYVTTTTKKSSAIENEELDNLDGKALLAGFTIGKNMGMMDVNLDVSYLQNDENFQSDLAMSPEMRANRPILNSYTQFNSSSLDPILDMFRSGSLENMYYTVYRSTPQMQTNLTGKGLVGDVPAEAEYYRLFNNYELAHYYRNGYYNGVMKRREIEAVKYYMDPAVNLSLPFGQATPDRKGFGTKADIAWNNAAELNLRYANYKADETGATYTDMGAGLGVNVARLIGFSKDAELSGSWEESKEDKWLERKSTRIVAGGKVGIWRGLSVLAGYQSLKRDYGIAYTTEILAEGDMLVAGILPLLQGSEETLILAGPQVKVSEGSYLTLQYGLMSNKVKYVDPVTGAADELSIDKTLLSAEMTVQF